VRQQRRSLRFAFAREWRVVAGLGAILLFATNCNELLDMAPGEAKGPSSGGTTGRGGAAGSAGSPLSPCTSNEECRPRADDWQRFCLNGECVDITTDECNLVLSATDPVHARDPIIFGAYMNPAPASIETEPFFWNVRLALDEFASFSPYGLPVAGGSQPVLVLVCTDPGIYSEVMGRALDHLIDTVHVPGIFMLSDPDSVLIAARRTFEEREQDVLLFHDGAPHFALEEFSDDGRVWHMLPSDAWSLPVYRQLVERVEQHVNPGLSRPTRVAVIHEAGTDELLAALRVNDKPLSSQLGEDVFHVSLADLETLADLEVDIVIQRPVGGIALAIEWTVALAGKRPPFHVFFGDVSLSPFEEIQQAIDADPTLRTRLVGARMQPFDDAGVRASYLTRIGAVTPPEIDLGDSGALYDLSYLMFYAAAARSDAGRLGGRQLGDGMRRLLEGDRYEVGPNDMPYLFEHFKRSPDASLRLVGTLGEPDFNPETGNRERFGSVWCIDESLSFVYDALLYDPTSQTLTGEFPCFDL